MAARVNREVVDVLGEELADPTKSFCLRWLELPQSGATDGKSG